MRSESCLILHKFGVIFEGKLNLHSYAAADPRPFLSERHLGLIPLLSGTNLLNNQTVAVKFVRRHTYIAKYKGVS